MRTKKKDIAVDEETTDAAPIPPSSTSGATPTTIAVTESLPIARFTRAQEPISEQQQRELFKWMLEDKRKIKTVDPEEKKRIDEEKAILKQFLRAKSIPSIWTFLQKQIWEESGGVIGLSDNQVQHFYFYKVR